MGATVVLVGCGKMGGAMLAGWQAARVASRMVVVDPYATPASLPDGVEVLATAADLPADLRPQAVVLAVKPQMMDQALPDYRRFADMAVFLSVAAGKPIAYFQRHLGEGAAVVRAMPNTPAAIGRGISVAVASAAADTCQKNLCHKLLEAAGEVAWTADEGQIDAVTAVSGSGPAYVFLMVEAMAKAGMAAGLPEDLALRLARATVAGSGELLHRSPEPADQLRRNVTSPNGTTQAALDVLMAEDGLEPLMRRAVLAAQHRSRELAG
ncbi:MAG: pyrroline-5-carboxylate reductase [Pseudomonadota bacterium]|jgi:pyrroline-5-carboxylate reductase